MLIYGHRRYGTIHTPAGDVGTFFFHVYFLPLFPTTGVRLKGERELPAPLNRASIAVAYARSYGLFATAGLFALRLDSMARGAAWLLPALAVTLATAAAWFVVGARERSPRRWALGLGLPALAVLLTLVPSLTEHRRRGASELQAELDALPPAIARKLEGRSEDEVRAFLAMAKETKKSPGTTPVVSLEPHSTNCRKKGDLEACLAMGRAAAPTDSFLAAFAFERACAGSLAEGCLQWGLTAESRNDFAKATGAFERACVLGSGEGCAHQALGLSTTHPAAAAKLYEKACSLDSASGCRSLGEALRRGSGVKKSSARASSAFKKACALGDPAACSG